jgi:pilus assembly protein CpaB
VTDVSQYEERGLKTKAYPGEVILQAKLGEKNAFGPSLSIPPGMRVVTVPVNMTTVHSGMIRPGDRVDVLVTYSIRKPGQAEQSRTKTVLEYIEVFAIDRVREADSGEAGKGAKAENLSVLVDPEQAHVLMLAANKGKLQMALRNGADKDQANVATIDDKIFDDFKATAGRETEEEPKEPVADKKSEAKNFKEFLQTDSAPEAAPEAPAEDEWAIEIFEGETRRVETIKIPRRSGGTTTNGPAAAPANKSSTDVPPVEAA